MAYDEDTCPICHQILDDPATTHCGHTACLACLLTWVAASNPETQPLDFRFKIPEKPSIDWLYFSCPLCRAQTYASFDGARREQLRLEGKQQDIDPDMDSIQNVSDLLILSECGYFFIFSGRVGSLSEVSVLCGTYHT